MYSVLLFLSSIPPAPPEVKVPHGFSISLYSDNPLAPDIYTMTIDDAGRVLVAGRGYVRVLVDDDGDGVADRAIDLIDGLKDGPMGLLAEGDSLYVVSEGGLQRYRGYNGKDKLKQPPETLVKLKTSGEHDAHMVRRGPDGWLYLLCGNSAGVSKNTIFGKRSPVKDPVAGALIRISPDGKEVEVVSDGFRNPYSFDFNLDGEPFAADSDNERCVGLPWYESCRFYHLMPGGNYGWRSPQLGKFWRKPPYFLDCVPPVCYHGRGSPTGVACYRHTHFPEEYRGGFFLADWTFGRIDFVKPEDEGSTYTGESDVFAEATGTSGFAPTALAVHPKTGELFVSIGGRGTRGGVYRIKHDTNPPGKPLPIAKRTLEWSTEACKRWLADCKWDGVKTNTGTNAEQRTRRHSLELMLHYSEKIPWGEYLTDAIKPNLKFPDTPIQLATARAVRGLAIKVGNVNDLESRFYVAYARLDEDPYEAMKVSMQILQGRQMPISLKLKAVRLLQLAYGDLTADGTSGTIWEGYTLRNPKNWPVPQGLDVVIRSYFTRLRKTEEDELRAEFLRTLVAFGIVEDLFPWLLTLINFESCIEDDIHYLAVLSRTNREWSGRETRWLVTWLLHLEEKVTRDWVARDTNWSLRLEEILEALGKANPKIGELLLKSYEFGKPEHFLFVKPLGIPAAEAARKFLNAAENDPNYAWTPGLVQFLDCLSLQTSRPVLLKLWEQQSLQDSILRVLANGPEQGDQSKFVQGLASFDPEVVRLSARSLEKLPASSLVEELAGAIKALRKLVPEDKSTRVAIVSLLQKRTGESFAADSKPWTEWATRKYPEIARMLATSDGFDPIAWKKREAVIPWDKGEVERGRVVFIRATCASCHDGGRAMGPSLQGVSKRFSKDDLLTAILEPSKDVSPRYRPTRLTTNDDKVYLGMVIYEANDGVILQTNPDTVVRIAGTNIVSKRTIDVSLMPVGLLDKLSDLEIADLFVYLRAPETVKQK